MNNNEKLLTLIESALNEVVFSTRSKEFDLTKFTKIMDTNGYSYTESDWSKYLDELRNNGVIKLP